MEHLAFKIKISVLWLIYAGAVDASGALYFMMPGVIEKVMAGTWVEMQISTGFLLFASLFWLIPLTMAFLTLILKYTANRWANFVLGIVLAVLNLAVVIGYLSRGELGGHLLMGISMIVVPALIAWYAWNWPKQET